MKERSLIAFTLLAQTAVGSFWTLGALYLWYEQQAGLAAARDLTAPGWPAVGLVAAVGIFASVFHLGDPTNCWRALGNLRGSWLSREILLATTFAGGSLLFAAVRWLDPGASAAAAVVATATAFIGLALVHVMGNAYRLRTIPAWDTWATPVSFLAATLTLGPLATGALLLALGTLPVEGARGILLWAMALLAVELSVLSLWLSGLSGSPAARDSAARIARRSAVLLRLRLALSVAAAVAAGAALLGPPEGAFLREGLALLAPFGLVLVSEVLGRALFYAARVRHGV